MDEDTLNQFLTIGRILRKRVYSIQMPQAVILDLDSTLLDAYGVIRQIKRCLFRQIKTGLSEHLTMG